MAEKRLYGRAVQKHDTQSNWDQTTNFVPMAGELIIYDIDENYNYERFKIGDGKTDVKSLPFADANKVDKVSGKGLSTNDYTTEEKNKLAGIAAGANKTIVDESLSGTSTNPVQNKVINDAIVNISSLVGDTSVSSQISTAIANKVDKIDGKGLSANDYTTAEKTKLSGISAGAEVNQNAFSNVVVGSTTIAAGADADTITLSSGANITMTPDATGKKITIAATDSTYTTVTATKHGLMTWPDKVKLDGIDPGANKTTVDSALSDTSTNPVQNKVVNSALAGKAASSHPHDVATASANGFMSAADKTALDNVVGLVGDTAVSEQISSAVAGAMSATNPTGTGSFSLNRRENSTVGNHSVAIGYNTTADGNYSYAAGYESNAWGECSTASGFVCEAVGDYAQANGYMTYAEDYAYSNGYCTYAQSYQFVVGKYNESVDGDAPSSAEEQSADTSIFMIGYGKRLTPANAFRVTSAGKCMGASAFAGSGADFAEYFEWFDGNPDNEDRRGKIVTLDGDKIRLATAEDDYILGVVSVSGCFIGNSQSEEWRGKYLKDVFGENLTQEVEVPEKVDKKTGETIPAHTVKQFVVNPEYDREQKYVSREFRKEWAPVGFHGQVVVVDDGTCQVNSYCKPSIDGVGTASNDGYRVMARLDDTHIKVLVR